MSLSMVIGLSGQEITYSSETYGTLQGAVDILEASTDETHTLILPIGEYQERVSVASNLTIRGAETFGTRWSSEDAGLTALLQVTANVIVEIERITFYSANLGIGLSGQAQANIHNNIFAMGSTNTAIESLEESSANLYHNSFHTNGVAFEGAQSSGVTNNLFYMSTNSILGISSDNFIGHNHFEGEPDGNRLGSDNTTGSLNFVNHESLDLHLQSTSPVIDGGSQTDGNDALDDSAPDLGAYGGNRMDLIPAPVVGVEVTSTSQLSSNVEISIGMDAYTDYQVQGFLLYYDTDESGEPYGGNVTGLGPSPVDLGNNQTASFSNIDLSNDVATANLLSLTPRNNSLIATWEEVEGATSYELRYRVAGSSSDYEDQTVGVVTQATLSGLTNGVAYEVELRALYQPTIYVALSAYYDQGVQREQTSRLSSSSLTVPDTLEGQYSASLEATPEETQPYPLLPDTGGGCLLAK